MKYAYFDSDPFVEILIKDQHGSWISFLMYVDSGAFTSVLTLADATDLGLNLEKGKHIDLQGVGGSVSAYLHPVEIKIANKTLKIEVAFSTSYETPRLLGRKGVFNHFTICFNDTLKDLTFT